MLLQLPIRVLPLQRHRGHRDWRQRRVRTLTGELPESAWERCSAGAGAHGLRFYDWARIELLAGWLIHLARKSGLH